jgi:group I intron endonuclease
MQYVGQAKNLKHRWQSHLGEIKTDYNHPFYNAMRKYGGDKFSIVQIDVADSLEELNEQETFHCHRLNTLWPNGYNLAVPGGREEMSDAAYRRVCAARVDQSLESRRKMSQTLKDKPRKQFCKNGHPFDGINTYLRPDGGQACKECRSIASKKFAQTKNKKQFCRQGHLLDVINTILFIDGRRKCRECASLSTTSNLPRVANSEKQICKHGHPFNDENTYVNPKNLGRTCLTCYYQRHGLTLPAALQKYAILGSA